MFQTAPFPNLGGFICSTVTMHDVMQPHGKRNAMKENVVKFVMKIII
jgi:hypothetical protein